MCRKMILLKQRKTLLKHFVNQKLSEIESEREDLK